MCDFGVFAIRNDRDNDREYKRYSTAAVVAVLLEGAYLLHACCGCKRQDRRVHPSNVMSVGVYAEMEITTQGFG